MYEKPVCLWVLFDGVENSVFESQVLRVANDQIKSGKFEKVVILSFQSDLSKAKDLISGFDLPEGLEFVLHRKLPFFGTLSLDSCVDATSNEIFKSFPTTIIARGPISGYICTKAMGKVKDEKELLKSKSHLPELIIQARGLLAKEYEYVNRASQWNPFLFPVRWFVKKQLESVEKRAYGEMKLARLPFSIKIESVTQSLSDYLVEEFGASYKRIKAAAGDLIEHLSAKDIEKYRREGRLELGLYDKQKVYCYAGSAKPWQCPEQTVDFFCSKREKDPSAHLLVVSQDKELFKKIIEKKGLDPEAYTLVTSKNDNDLFKLLSIADFGILLREDHPVNWVSRPTKVLNYLACGLKVEHNNTVRWVIDKLSFEPAKAEKPRVAKKVIDEEIAEAKSTKVAAAKKAPKVTLKSASKSATKAKDVKKKTVAAKPAKKTTTKTTAKAAEKKTSTAKTAKKTTTKAAAKKKTTSTKSTAAKTKRRTSRQSQIS